MGGVSEVPASLSPSRVEKFLSCPLAFRFATIDKLPEPPTVATTRGSLVHRALELAYARPAPERTPEAFQAALALAVQEFRTRPDVLDLALDADGLAALERECGVLVARASELEDPATVHAIGLELRLAADVGGLELRGVIDRLDRRDDGELVVVDYKTGRAPSASWEQRSLSGVQFYAFLCERVLGRRPAAVRLVYLSSGEVIEARPSAQSTRFVTTRAAAIRQAVELAARTDDFRPRPSARCATCTFRPWCPAFGGDPARAAVEAGPARLVTSVAS
jgi:putative RecB family exonuclease